MNKNLLSFKRNNATYTHLLFFGELTYFSTGTAIRLIQYDLESKKTIAMLENERNVFHKNSPFQDRVFHAENFTHF